MADIGNVSKDELQSLLNSGAWLSTQPIKGTSPVTNIGVDSDGRVEVLTSSGSNITLAALLDLKGSAGTSALGLLSYYSSSGWAGKDNFTTGETPSVLFMYLQHDGGAGNADTLTYPDGITFKHPPLVVGKIGDVDSYSESTLQEAWDSGTGMSVFDLNVTRQTRSGFSYTHAGTWPGGGMEWMMVMVIGVMNPRTSSSTSSTK